MSIPVVTSITARCVICGEPVDLTGPHAIGSHGNYHRACFDATHPEMVPISALEAERRYFGDRMHG